MSHTKRQRYQQTSVEADNFTATLPIKNLLRCLGIRLRQHKGSHYVACPWVSDRTCPTRGMVKINRRTGAFHCYRCAPNGGDVLTYRAVMRSLIYELAVNALIVREG